MKKLTVSVKSGHTGEMRTTIELSSDPALNPETVRLTVRRSGCTSPQNGTATAKKRYTAVSSSSGSTFALPEINLRLGLEKKR